MLIPYRLSIRALLLVSFAIPAQAALIDRGGGFIYDDVLDITWLQDASYGNTGAMTWANAISWAATLSVADTRDGAGGVVYDDWRLPRVTDTGVLGCNQSNFGTDCGFNVDTGTGEIASLYYDTLGNIALYDSLGQIQSGYGFQNAGPFINVQSSSYWSETEYAPMTSYAWYTDVHVGHQNATAKNFFSYAWAVRSGDVAVVPAPPAGWLLGLSLFALGWRQRRRQSNSKS